MMLGKRFDLMAVKGYDRSLSRKSIKRALREKFSSCGEVSQVELYAHKRNRESAFACFFISGQGAKEKALQLNGSDMGGFKLVVEYAYRSKPHRRRDIPIGLPPLRERLSDPNWREKYYSRYRTRSRLCNVEKKKEE
ncbi:unnamed protein product [Microthlaspi erraticum]|uniref:RRM domain-containing protein n=1 Tax=Microthlaspi erraticum TaxID=1685480 RepID=A0A6D2K8X2_9BRAS|nr:unnamed protein product [Microthlaspi erraticum]